MLELVLRLAVSLGVVLGLFWLVARTGARKLGGSLLSAQTWSQAWSAATAKSSTAQVVDGATHE
jgi:hypothetical protein